MLYELNTYTINISGASRVIRQPLGPHYTAEELTRAEAGQRRDELSAVKRRGCFRYVAQEKQSKCESNSRTVHVIFNNYTHSLSNHTHLSSWSLFSQFIKYF